MREYVIMTDSCCDLTARMAEDLELDVVPLSLHMEGADYKNYLDGREIGFKDFYDRIRRGATATTAAVSVGEFQSRMREHLERDEDILCICFSSGLSTTYQSACIAADDLRPEFPEAKLCVVDSLCASLGQGLLLYLCAQEKKLGRSIDEVHTFAEVTKGHICHWFTVDDLIHLKRGGRIGAATALFGTMLSIKPVMHMDPSGHLVPVSKARGRKSSLLALVDRMEELSVEPQKQTVFICHGDCENDALFVADEVRRRFGTEQIYINYVGPVIGNHTGCGVISLFFIGTKR
ncbi:MAG: DegV family protein [Oscillibacter sp.]|jgi:DegV family protein with EDD domain|nr:DegV family protein [Oscillibacter sp.]